jgi:peptide chain release factor 3
MTLQEEIDRRRTFAIISHPDAGKTTLTEKLLLFGGAIHVAGAVKSNKIKKTATSDFMEIERQRGISVATSVMGFEYDGKKVNILDTPGHQDFAEDTYRTLTAADSVIVVVDVAKGVEAQTEKLVQVCRLRDIPIIIFINKLDREGKDPFELLDEIEAKLGIRVSPVSWPIGMGKTLKGVYSIFNRKLNLYTGEDKQYKEEPVQINSGDREQFKKYAGEKADVFLNELELVEEVYPAFDVSKYREAHISPVFFGSALYNFGVKELLEYFLEIAPSPTVNHTETRDVFPNEEPFSGFVFKIHANMDPNHRNRIAFVRVCSGKFERNKNYLHVRQGRTMKFSNPTAFMASKKSVIDDAYPGDIIGLHDSGNFVIGDTLTEGEKLKFIGIPTFAPELFRYIENADPLKSKQLSKGVDQLMDEGVAQLLVHQFNGRKIIATVGALQYEVIEHRLKNEYNATCRYEPVQLYKAVWLKSTNMEQLNDFKKRKYQFMAKDKHNRDVYLAESSYALQMAQEKFPAIEFLFTSEF